MLLALTVSVTMTTSVATPKNCVRPSESQTKKFGDAGMANSCRPGSFREA
jgi:hypothetical protein